MTKNRLTLSLKAFSGRMARKCPHCGVIGTAYKIAAIDVYDHVSRQHLKRYIAEFDFRYNHRIALGVDDTERALKALLGVKGKRLMHSQEPHNGEGAI